MGRPSSINPEGSNKKRKIINTIAETAVGAVSSPHRILKAATSYKQQDEITSLEFEIKKRMEFHRLKAESQVDELKSVVNFALIYLPRDVQTMKARDYFQKFGGQLNLFEEHERNTTMQIQSNRLVDASTKKKTARKIIAGFGSHKKNPSSFLNTTQNTSGNSTVISTPRQEKDNSFVPASAVVQAKKTPGGRVTSKVTVLVGEKSVDLTPGTMGRMDASSRQSAELQLENMAAQLQSFLKQIKPTA